MSISSTVEGFVDTLRQFLEAMASTYEECDDTQMVKNQFLVFCTAKGAGKEIIGVFHEQISPFYDDITRGNLGVVKGIETLDKVRFHKKWCSADAETRTCIAEYVQMLCKFSQTYSILSKMPSDLMNSITNVANGLAEKVQSGQHIDFSKLNFEELGKQAQQNLDMGEVIQLAQMMASDDTFKKLLSK